MQTPYLVHRYLLHSYLPCTLYNNSIVVAGNLSTLQLFRFVLYNNNNNVEFLPSLLAVGSLTNSLYMKNSSRNNASGDDSGSPVLIKKFHRNFPCRCAPGRASLETKRNEF